MALTQEHFPPATAQLFFEGKKKTTSWQTMRARGSRGRSRRREQAAHALPQTPAELDALISKTARAPDNWLQRRARAASAAAWIAEDMAGSNRADGGKRLWEQAGDDGEGVEERDSLFKEARARASQRRPRTAIVVSSLACDDDVPFRPFTADQRRQRQALQRSLRTHSSPGAARRAAPLLAQLSSRSRLLPGSRLGSRSSCAKLELIRAWDTARPSPSAEHASMRNATLRAHPKMVSRGESRGGAASVNTLCTH